MTHSRKNRGTCSRSTTVALDEQGRIENIEVAGGCDGNLKGLCRLLQGQPAQEATARLEGITCDSKATSCPDQMALCLREALEKQG